MVAYDHILALVEARPAAHRALTWSARCPAHEDKHPSLRLWIGHNGCLIIRCWTGKCPLPVILDCLGLTMRDLFPEPTTGPYLDGRSPGGPRGLEGGRVRRDSPFLRRSVVAAYDYQDENGRFLFQSVRFEPKNFCQRTMSPTGAWVWSLEGVRRVPFQLPRLVDPRNRHRPILIVEGEKDVLNLQEAGYLATCNPGGTAMGWQDHYSQLLQGRNVVVLPDNDEPGRKHADSVIGNLLRHGVGSVRLVQLPGLPEKGDVSDWLPEHGAQALRQLILSTPEYICF